MYRRAAQPPALTCVAVVELNAPLESFDFSTADRWDFLLLWDGTPVMRIGLPSPGPVDSAALAHALLHPYAESQRRHAAIAGRLLSRLRDDVPKAQSQPAVSVVVCTHGRPQYLPTVLDALGRLRPAPYEVVIVDNAPGLADCREDVEARGFRYVREDRKGLDNARNAGIAAARGEIVAFTDDDCVPPVGWLRHVGEAFTDPMVAALTGPAFPYLLDTAARVRMEAQASLSRGVRRAIFDWTLISPLQAGAVGVGANMLLRRSVVDAVVAPFPPELDAGTASESGGDMYVFARLLAAGHRVVYDPRGFVFHQHRSDWPALERAVRGYGTGVVASGAKLLVEDREFEAPRAAVWLAQQYGRVQRRRVMGRADAVETRIAWEYLRGGFAGVRGWRVALRDQRAIEPGMRPTQAFPPPTSRSIGPPDVGGADDAPPAGDCAMSVVIPTVGRPLVLARCLEALAQQTLPLSSFEVIVVDDSPGSDATVDATAAPGLDLRVHRSGGQGAAIARNEGAAAARGDLLLFLDDDLVPLPDLLARHFARHRKMGSRAVVIGYSPPAPPRAGLAASGAALWWEDQFAALRRSLSLTFTEMLSGNVSLARTTFLDGLQFDPAFAAVRREDWEWGIRLLEAGVSASYAPEAVAAHEFALTAGDRLRACRGEGMGDVRILRRHPAAAPYLPLARHRPPSLREPWRLIAFHALGAPAADTVLTPMLDLLERARLRHCWSWLYRKAQRAAYLHGLRKAGWRPEQARPMPVLAVELDDDDPIPPPAAFAPRVALSYQGQPLAEIAPVDGRWGPEVADEIASSFPVQLALPAPERGSHGGRRSAPPVTVVTAIVPDPSDDLGTDVTLRVVDAAARFWAEALAMAELAETELIAIALPGAAPDWRWLDEALVAFDASRMGLLCGRALPDAWPVEPLTLHDSSPGRVPFAPLGGVADYLVFRSSAIEHLRESVDKAPLGDAAVALACVEECLRAGWLVGHRNVHGLRLDGSAGSARARERAKLVGWGALLYEDAAARGALGRAVWLGALTAGGFLRGALRSRRGSHTGPLTPVEVSRALMDGYAVAARRAPEPRRAA